MNDQSYAEEMFNAWYGWGDEYAYDDYEKRNRKREREWKKGVHVDRRGSKHLLSEMSRNYLLRVISYFHRLDTTPLKEELRKRE
jgi:hypothetical protein